MMPRQAQPQDNADKGGGSANIMIKGWNKDSN